MSDPTPTTATPPVQKSAAKVTAPARPTWARTISVRVLVFARPHPSFNAQSSIAADPP